MKTTRTINLIFGEFLNCENPFNAAHQPMLRSRFNTLNSRVYRAWWRTMVLMPGAVLAALATGPLYRMLGLPHDVIALWVRVFGFLPLLVAALGVATGVPAYWQRRILLRQASR